MKRFFFFVIPALLLLASCTSRKGISEVAMQYFPDKLSEAFSEYLGEKVTPEVSGLEVIYDCDSLCMIQCYAVVPDPSGDDTVESVRYTFAKDPFFSRVEGRPIYYHTVKGAAYFNKEEIKQFQKKMEDGGSRLFAFYLASCEPLTPVFQQSE